MIDDDWIVRSAMVKAKEAKKRTAVPCFPLQKRRLHASKNKFKGMIRSTRFYLITILSGKHKCQSMIRSTTHSLIIILPGGE